MKSIFKILTFLFLTQSIPLKGDDGIALIDVDITKLETGPLPKIINEGSLSGDFEAELDIPNVETIDGVNAVTLDGFGDWYVGPDSTPLSGDADRSIEAWVWNQPYQLKKPSLLGDEEVVLFQLIGPCSTEIMQLGEL